MINLYSCFLIELLCQTETFMQLERLNRLGEHFIYRHIPWSGKYILITGCLGRAMVLGSFQCLGVLLLWHIAGQGPAVLATGAGWVGYLLYISFHLVYPILARRSGKLQVPWGQSSLTKDQNSRFFPAALSRLKIIWRDKNISLASKVKLMWMLILSTFLYACESWTLIAEI